MKFSWGPCQQAHKCHSLNKRKEYSKRKYNSMYVLVAQLWPTLCDPTDCSPPGSSVHGILQVKIPDSVAIPFSRWSSQARDRTHVSCLAVRIFAIWAIREIMCLTPENMPFILLGLKSMESQNRLPFWWGTISIGWKKRKTRTSFGVQEEEIYSALGLPSLTGTPQCSPLGVQGSGILMRRSLVTEPRLLKLSAVHWVIY